MSNRHSFDFTFTSGRSGSAARRPEKVPMRLLIMGGFLGDAGTPSPGSLAASGVHRIDIDNFEQLLAKLAPTLDLALDPPGVAPTVLVFRSMEDFHPDRLAARDPVLLRLREIKDRLQDPATFPEAAEDLAQMPDESLGKAIGETVHQTSDDPPARGPETDAETLERLLGAGTKTTSESRPPANTLVDDFVQRLVAPEVVPENPDVRTYLDAADRAAGDRLRLLLHHPRFQRLEAGWRGLFELISTVEGDEGLEISLLSVDEERLREAVTGSVPSDSELARLLSRTSSTTLDAGPWATIIGNYGFDADIRDIRVLSALGSICHQLGIGFLASARPGLLGCPDLRTHSHPRDWVPFPPDIADAWKEFRESPGAQSIGLALPQVLLRLPYGERTDPCDLFPFEEMPGPPTHDAFLWGNPVFLCARVIARDYCENSGEASTVAYGDIADLPAYVDRQDPETAMQACAEVYLSETVGQAIADAGFIPILSYKQRNAVRVGPIRGLATT